MRLREKISTIQIQSKIKCTSVMSLFSLLLTSPLQRCSFSTKENTISSLSLSLEGITKVQNNDNDKEHTQIQIVIGRDRGGHIHIYMLLVVEVVVVVVII